MKQLLKPKCCNICVPLAQVGGPSENWLRARTAAGQLSGANQSEPEGGGSEREEAEFWRRQSDMRNILDRRITRTRKSVTCFPRYGTGERTILNTYLKN